MYGNLAQRFRSILSACSDDAKACTAWANHGDPLIGATAQ